MMRGEYRSIHAALTSDPHFISLSVPAKALWFVLKLKLGASGIAYMPAHQHQFAKLTGISLQSIDKAKEEMRPHWLIWEGDILWLRNGLKFEPKISLENENHRKGVLEHLRGMPVQSIVKAFCDYYNLPDIYGGKVQAMPLDYPSNDIGHIAGPEKSGRKIGKKEPKEILEKEFDKVWPAYPKRKGSNPRNMAFGQYIRRRKEGISSENLLAATEEYGRQMQEDGKTDTEYVMQAKTFFGINHRWLEYYELHKAREVQQHKRMQEGRGAIPLTEKEREEIKAAALKAMAESKKILRDRHKAKQ